MREQTAVGSRDHSGSRSGIPIAIAAREIEAIDALIDPPVQFLILDRITAATGANGKYASDHNNRKQRVVPPFHTLISNERSRIQAEKVIVQACRDAPALAHYLAHKRG
ncbi:hypothetical protein [Bradyrhizobium sp. C9]|uniref:hypothetical protein n=1 Tax=Bradyrhizobium sp. C9 TaxID=142585 RepID=UPI0018EA123C|nr:hypothetical protein [Bradyrhizobium sp. C9]